MKTCKWALAFVVLCAVAALAQSPAALELPDAPHVAAEAVPEAPANNTVGPFPASPAIAIAPAPAPRPRVLDKKFIALGVLTFALTTADIEMTQHCLHRQTCVELNPVLPHSRGGMYAVNVPVNAAVMYFSYWRRAHGRWGWWIPPVVDIGAHTVGVGSNIRFVGK